MAGPLASRTHMIADPKSRRSCGECCTRLVDVGVRLGNAPILERINLHMHCGELTALVGPNGAGKTTLLKAILGEAPHAGVIHFLPVTGHGREDAPVIGYLPQQFDFDRDSPINVHDLFATAVGPRQKARFRRVTAA